MDSLVIVQTFLLKDIIRLFHDLYDVRLEDDDGLEVPVVAAVLVQGVHGVLGVGKDGEAAVLVLKK